MRAIVLAAETGGCLNPVTEEKPRSLTDVGGVTLLGNTLEILDLYRFKEAVVVLGNKAARVMKEFGEKFGNLNIIYVVNEKWKEGSDSNSLWHARRYMDSPLLLVDSGYFFEEDVLFGLDSLDRNKTYWFADKFKPEEAGLMLITDTKGRLTRMEVMNSGIGEPKDNFHKPLGIMRLTAGFAKKLSELIDFEISMSGEAAPSIDALIKKYLEEVEIYVNSVEGLRWTAIKEMADLKRAEAMFKA